MNTPIVDFLTSLSDTVFDLYPLERVYLIGSHARDEAGPESDIDLIYIPRSDARFTLFDMFRLQADIERYTERRVDITSDAGVRADIRPYIESDKILIYS